MNICFEVPDHIFEIQKPQFWSNPTSPLGIRWFRTCVPASIPQLLHPMLLTVLEEGFSPPPTSSPGLWTGWSRAVVTTYIQYLRHSGHHLFFHHFSNPLLYRFLLHFGSQLGTNIAPTSIENQSISRAIWKTTNICLKFFIDFLWIWHPPPEPDK